MTNLRLNKLLYFAQGNSLARTGKRLFNDVVQAWQLGPVVPVAYDRYSVCGSGPISESAPNSEEFPDDVVDLLIDVMRYYGRYTTSTLVDMTHRPDTPWARYYISGIKRDIPVSEIRNSFSRGGAEWVSSINDPSDPFSKIPIYTPSRDEQGVAILPRELFD